MNLSQNKSTLSLSLHHLADGIASYLEAIWRQQALEFCPNNPSQLFTPSPNSQRFIFQFSMQKVFSRKRSNIIDLTHDSSTQEPVISMKTNHPKATNKLFLSTEKWNHLSIALLQFHHPLTCKNKHYEARSSPLWPSLHTEPTDDKCNPEPQLLRQLQDNGQSAGSQAVSHYYSLLWSSTQFVSIFYSIGQDSTSGYPLLPSIHSRSPNRHIYILHWGVPNETVPSQKMSCVVQAVRSAASVCSLQACHSAQPSPLPGSAQVKQHLSSREAPLYFEE